MQICVFATITRTAIFVCVCSQTSLLLVGVEGRVLSAVTLQHVT